MKQLSDVFKQTQLKKPNPSTTNTHQHTTHTAQNHHPQKKITQLADQIISLPPEERAQIGPFLRASINHPKLEKISTQGLDLGPQATGGAPQAEEKKAEKTAFDVKLEKFDPASKIKVIKEVRSLTELGLKEAKDLVEKSPSVLKQGVTKEEAAAIIDKIKAAGGVAVME